MPTNYKEAASRHFRDANFLWDTGDPTRFLNASQLYGFSAECSLKAVLVGLGLPVKADGGVKDHKKYGHLPYLWNEFSLYATGALGAHYLAVATPVPPATGHFDTWKVSDRYAENSIAATRQAEFDDHRKSSIDLIALLELAIEDGTVT